ncbi:MAG: hypothetical protein JSV91_12050 [Phycisphaerales bacterium]|nr:MAG: hypothetical protein JSV91_12050 [Phycisphaerales bacterium]
MTRLIVILALVLQSVWSAAGGAAALCQGGAAYATLMGLSDVSSICCADSPCSCCADTQAACGCDETQPDLPAAPITPSSKDTTTLLVAALMPSVILVAVPGMPPQSPIEREAPAFQTHNQKHASLCVWRT